MMKPRDWTKVAIVFAVLALMPLVTMAQPSISVVFYEGVPGSHDEPTGAATQFKVDTPEIRAMLKVMGATQGMQLKVSWIAVDAFSTPDQEIRGTQLEVPRTGGQTRLWLTLPRPGDGWPPGNYKLDVYADDNLVTSAGFSVR